MTEVLLAGCEAYPMEPEGQLLVAGFAARGVTAAWVRWDDPRVDWAAARVVAVRSTWDYHERRDEFLAWAKSVDAVTRLLNGAETLAWNTDKRYLLDLIEAGLPVVPSRVVTDRAELVAAATGFPGRVVVKPCVGIGGIGVAVFDRAAGVTADELGSGPWLVQPVVESVTSEGETSVFVLGGEAVGQVRKVAHGGEIRVHPQYGGASTLVEVTDEAARLARATVAAAERLRGGSLPYARVDLMRLPGGALVVSELEATEPGLYLEVAPRHGEVFCDVVTRLLRDPH